MYKLTFLLFSFLGLGGLGTTYGTALPSDTTLSDATIALQRAAHDGNWEQIQALAREGKDLAILLPREEGKPPCTLLYDLIERKGAYGYPYPFIKELLELPSPPPLFLEETYAAPLAALMKNANFLFYAKFYLDREKNAQPPYRTPHLFETTWIREMGTAIGLMEEVSTPMSQKLTKCKKYHTQFVALADQRREAHQEAPA